MPVADLFFLSFLLFSLSTARIVPSFRKSEKDSECKIRISFGMWDVIKNGVGEK